MKRFEHPLSIKPSEMIHRVLLAYGCLLLITGLIVTPPNQLLPQLSAILVSSGVLLSDYFVLGGIGPALVNAGIVTLLALLLSRTQGLSYSGMSIAAIMIMGGFALFGKNPLNAAPILLGNYLFSRYQREPWSRYLYIGLFSTCLAPFVSYLWTALPFSPVINLAIGGLAGIFIGFAIPTVAPHTASFHLGYNLYNVGFAAGFIAIAIMSVLRGFRLDSQSVMFWRKGIDIWLALWLAAGCLALFLLGFILAEQKLSTLWRITRHSGRAIADFVFMDGVGPTFMNMAVMGLLCLGYLLLIGGDLNGPTLGAILTTIGFAAFGMHPRNCAPIAAGVWASTFLLRYQPADPSIQLAALFGFGLAPIAGQFGPIWGFVAGMLHCAIVTTVGSVYGGLNLYNNGFTAGLVALMLVPFIESLKREDESNAA